MHVLLALFTLFVEFIELFLYVFYVLIVRVYSQFGLIQAGQYVLAVVFSNTFQYSLFLLRTLTKLKKN